MKVLLLCQIDIDHWTVKFLDGQWKDKTGDYRIIHKGLEQGQKIDVKVKHWKKVIEPTTERYCGEIYV